MNAQQAYINGFVKRANEYGINEEQATELMKQAIEMPEQLKQSLMKTLRGVKINSGILPRAIAGGLFGAYTGGIGTHVYNSVAPDPTDENGHPLKDDDLTRARNSRVLKNMLAGGLLGLTAGGAHGFHRKNHILKKYLNNTVIPRFDELAQTQKDAPLNRLANLLHAETKDSKGDLQQFFNKHGLRFPGTSSNIE